MQKWHPLLTAALAPLYLNHFMSRLDYVKQLDDFADQLHSVSYDPNLSDEEKMFKLNTMDQRAILAVNSAMAHQTYLAVNAILQRTFPDVYAAHAQSAPQNPVPTRQIEVTLAKEGEGNGEVQ